VNKYATIPPGSDWKRLFRLGDVIPGPPDGRDFPALARNEKPVSLPSEFILPVPTVRVQTHGSCVAYTLGDQVIRGFRRSGVEVDVSEQEFYSYERERQNWLSDTQCSDSGLFTRSAAETAVRDGFVHESSAPSESYTSPCARSLPNRDQVQRYGAVEYRSARTLDDIKQLIYQFGVGVGCAFTLAESFYQTLSNGLMPEPSGAFVGGHYMNAVGWAVFDGTEYGAFQNSWGRGFGHEGIVYIPARYLDGSIGQDRGGRWVNESFCLVPSVAPPPEPEPTPPPVDPDDPEENERWFMEGFSSAKQMEQSELAGDRAYYQAALTTADTENRRISYEFAVRYIDYHAWRAENYTPADRAALSHRPTV